MFTSIDQFVQVWDSETTSTLSCFNHLTDESLGQDLLSGYRTIERTANHIVDCAASIPAAATLPISHEKKHYTHVADLVEAYTLATHKVKDAVIAKWTDDTLQENTMMYGESWKKAFALWVTVVHQIHHRGQLTVLMRMAGLKVPGVYGPAKEEWEAMNFPAAD
ncbi:MAG: DinB family protein [Sediminibacterium sp.]|nr:DinB family protein [Sediminibacterium sp.]